jgi:succinyl-diaminopimelate desuccinylase
VDKIQSAFAKVQENEDYIVDVLRRVIAVDTSVPPGENYDKLIDQVEPDFKKFGFNTERVVVPEDKVKQIPLPLTGPRTNLVAKLNNGKPPLSAYAHMDVVPIDEPWTQDPFGGEIIDGKLYGRGTVDMKYAIACFLGAVKVINEMGLEPHYDLGCLLCTDEEIGVYPGARYLAEEGYFSPHLVWMELGAIEPIVVIGAAGAIRIEVTAIGKSCHSGMNYLGVNAVEELVPVMQELLNLKKDVEKRLSRIPSFPLPGNPYDKMTPMFNLNIIKGGTKENIVPGECRLIVNRRYIPDENYDDVITEIEQALAKGRENSKLLDLKTKVVHLYTPVEVDPETPASKRGREAVKAVMGYNDFLYGGLSGSTDLGFVAQALAPTPVEVASFGVVRASNILAHAADEYVYVEDLVNMTKELVYYFAL